MADADLAHGVDVALHEFGHLVGELDEARLFVPAVDRDVLTHVLRRAPVLGEAQRGDVVRAVPSSLYVLLLLGIGASSTGLPGQANQRLLPEGESLACSVT